MADVFATIHGCISTSESSIRCTGSVNSEQASDQKGRRGRGTCSEQLSNQVAGKAWDRVRDREIAVDDIVFNLVAAPWELREKDVSEGGMQGQKQHACASGKRSVPKKGDWPVRISNRRTPTAQLST